MQGKNIPAGTIVPDVMHVKLNHTAKNIPMLYKSNFRASLIKDLIVLICDSKNRVAILSNVGAVTIKPLEVSLYTKSLQLNLRVASFALSPVLN